MDGPQPGDPTEAEIEQRAAEVRRRWSVKQEILRWTGPRPCWRTPIISTGDVQGELLEEILGDTLAAP